MRSRRLISFITAISLLMSLIGAIPVSASNSYDENNGIYTWVFEGNQTGPADVEDGILTIKLGNSNDTITSSGVWFNGGSDIKTKVEDLERYIKITPTSSGTIKATDNNGRLKIAKEGASSSLGNSNNTNKTLSVSLEKDNVYYIYPTGQTRITAISFESDEVSAGESVLEDKDSVTFSFGSDTVIGDVTQVGDEKYTRSAAYGFSNDNTIAVNSDNVTSTSDFTFNVRVPNGNYDITLGTTAETVSYEQIPNITYAKRIRTLDETKTFTAAVCDGTLDITIPANGELSSLTVAKQAAKTEREKPALFAVGDSTVNTTETNSSYPKRGASKTWGVCVDENKVTVPSNIYAFYNCGQAGANTITYYNDYEHNNQGHLDDVLLNIHPGDYVTVNLGINNKREKAKTGTTDDITDTSAYETIMRDYILQGILDRGGIPIVLTATPNGPIDNYAASPYYSDGVFACERTGSEARTSTLLSIANTLNIPVLNVGAWGNDYFNSITEAEATEAGYNSVLEYVQSMYIDHNHYKEALGTKIASYILSSVASMIEGEKEYTSSGTANSLTFNVDGAEKLELDTSSMPANDTVKEYEVTLSKNGKMLRSYRVPAAATVYTETVGADKVDVSAVYSYASSVVSSITSNKKLGDFENGRYNITVSRGGTKRYDIYVNDAMIVNNLNQAQSTSGSGREVSSGASYTANNINITTGSINVRIADSEATGVESIEVVKAPASVDRKTKVFVIGDSLVANYYGGNESSYLGTTQTGWGQTLKYFINSDNYEVVNLANSGYWAKNLYETAFTGVKANSENGDILLFESGYNDMEHSTDAEMTEYAGKIVDEAKAAGVVPILLNPNATADAYGETVKLGGVMKTVAETKDTNFIDLSKLTYNYLYSLYGSDKTTLQNNLGLKNDTTHTSYLGAMKYASIVAGELYKLYKDDGSYKDLVNTSYTYTQKDTLNNDIICNALEDVTQLSATASFNNMYGTNMLLQRGKSIKLDGTVTGTSQVKVTLTKKDDDTYTNEQTVTANGNKWSAELDAVTLSTPEEYQDAEYTLTVTPVSSNEGINCIPTTLTNIKFGDLYLCAGQSNMKFYLNEYLGLDYEESELKANPNIRIMQEPTAGEANDSRNQIVFARNTFQDTLPIAADWQPLTPDYAKTWKMSALIYSMATKLYEETGVPVGMLGTAYGDTDIAKWRPDSSKATWYSSRIHPLRNFAISGIFWYQGCNDKGNGYDYYLKNMTALVNEYRSLFGSSTLPFYFVQLARNDNVPEFNRAITAGSSNDTTGMKDVRRAQFDAYNNAADKTNFGLVSTLDIYGQYTYTAGKDSNKNARVNYHTGQKPIIAHRLVDWALKDIYNMTEHKDGTTIYTHGPVYKSKETVGSSLVVTFETSGNLKVMDSEQYADSYTDGLIEAGKVDAAKINEFEIAGSDGIYYPAAAEISGNKVTLTSSEVSAPVSVRYAYSPYPESPNLTDDSGLPTYAFTAEETVYPSWKFSFGTVSKDGYTQVSKTQTYGKDSKDYGFLGLDEESANYKAVVDGYDQRNGKYTTLTEGTDYVKSDNKKRPVRFAMKVAPNAYYKVKVTLSAEGGNADATLTSERRHFVLTEESITSGNELTKEFTVGVHNVRWKNRDSGSAKEENYADDMLNIGLLGENAALKSIEIQQIAKPKVLWIFGDSTVTDHVTAMPYNIFGAEAGWGAAAAKYVNDDVAVVNLSEGGLVTNNKAYFQMGSDDISSGDVVMLQFGHNEDENSTSTYTANLEYYRGIASAAGATFVLCSPIQRLENSDSVNNTYTHAAAAYANANEDVKYIDLNTLTGNFNTSLGTGAWYTHVAYWQSNGDGTYKAFNDATHLNDYGADNTCRMAMEKLAVLTTGYVKSPISSAVMPSESVMKNGGSEYVKPPYDNNELFPKSDETFDYAAEVTSVTAENNIVKSVHVKRNTTLGYITVFVDLENQDGTSAGTASHRLESAGANAEEDVDFTGDNLTIPSGGKAKIYVSNGAAVDQDFDKENVISNVKEINAEAASVKYMHFSFDDVYECMEHLNTQSYESAFEEPLLASLKALHDKYGAVFTLNCFLEGSNTNSSYAYKLSEVTDKYKNELAGASSWLKFAFHAKNKDAKYSSDNSDLANQYKTFSGTIVKIAGADSIDRVTRLGFFTGSLNNMKALKACEYGLIGFLTADDDRTDNYYLNLYDRNYISENNIWYDADNGLAAIHTQLRLESVANAAAREAQLASIANIDNGNATMVEVFTHESEYAKSFVKENFEEYIKWAENNGYTFDFAENHISEIQAWQTENPRVDAVTLPEGSVDLEWDFSKFTGTEKISGAAGEIDYDGLKINLTASEDKIEASSTLAQNGLYWKGQSNRYVKYTPTADGIIVAQIKTKSGGGSMKLTDSSGATVAEGNILDGYLIYDGCKAGETYSFIPTADYQRIMNVKYYETSDEPDTPPEPEDKVYHITADANGNETVVDTTTLYAPDFVKEYQVTTADMNGKKVKQYRVGKADSIAADTTGAAKVEIAPVFKFSRKVSASDGSYLGMDDLHSKVKLPGSYDSGRYDFTFIKALGKDVTDKSAANIDIYVNDGMVANNLYYTGYLRTIARGTEITYTAHDVVIDAEKGVELYSAATSQTGMDTVEVVKSPSIVNRVKKVWVIGDSLVQKYYGSLYKKSDLTTDRNMQCGWGQFLADYLTDEVEVVNLAKAGDYAGNLKSTAFTGVIANGQAGDIVVIEGGYNDYKKSNQNAFENAMTTMYTGAAGKNMIPVIVTPNCSMTVETVNGTELDDYSENLRFAEQGRALATANDWNLADLAKLSYDFYSETYGTDASAREIIASTYLFPASLGEGAEADIDDILHHNELGAQKWASMVVQELYNKKILQNSEVNFENKYSYTDTAGNSFTLSIKTSEIEPAKQVTKITADYDEHGVLLEVKTELIDASAVPETVNNTKTHKVFYWESLDSMKPYEYKN